MTAAATKAGAVLAELVLVAVQNGGTSLSGLVQLAFAAYLFFGDVEQLTPEMVGAAFVACGLGQLWSADGSALRKQGKQIAPTQHLVDLARSAQQSTAPPPQTTETSK